MKKRYSILVALLLLTALLCGCGALSMSADTSMNANAGGSAAYAPAENAYMAEDYGWAGEAETAAAPSGAGGNGLPGNVKMIYTAFVALESTEFDAAAGGLEALVRENGGWFESSSFDNYSRYRSAEYTVRVPAENFHAFCARVGEVCRLRSIRTNEDDVSEMYYDTETRLATQRTKLERLQALLAQAGDMEDIITLESAISETELAIENLTGTLRKYDSLVGYSTIEITLSEVYKLSEEEAAPIGFGARMAAAFREGTGDFVDGVQDLLVGLAYGWAGWLLFFAVIAVAAALILRHVRKKRAPAAPPEDTKE